MELLLPQGKLILSRGKLPLAGLVAGGRGPDPNWLLAAMRDLPLYGADKGVEYCVRAGSIPSLPVGTGTAVTLEAGKKSRRMGPR